ncbi:hypothetical protein CK203_103132 [Vitis vinifera]|uniref:Uncharacterized protein n=1 Tax=Vitis vinifera TaxID=29760 RepID=A0A438F094_VITVI|nr:hypothetical protein CK203_103132 [Vitis vinifera]
MYTERRGIASFSSAILVSREPNRECCPQMNFAVHQGGLCSSHLRRIFPVTGAIASAEHKDAGNAARRRRSLKMVDRELSKGNYKTAVSLVKQLNGKPGGLRGFGAAKQGQEEEETCLSKKEEEDTCHLLDTPETRKPPHMNGSSLNLQSPKYWFESPNAATGGRVPITGKFCPHWDLNPGTSHKPSPSLYHLSQASRAGDGHPTDSRGPKWVYNTLSWVLWLLHCFRTSCIGGITSKDFSMLRKYMGEVLVSLYHIYQTQEVNAPYPSVVEADESLFESLGDESAIVGKSPGAKSDADKEPGDRWILLETIAESEGSLAVN